jgi:hypothetical protein
VFERKSVCVSKREREMEYECVIERKREREVNLPYFSNDIIVS